MRNFIKKIDLQKAKNIVYNLICITAFLLLLSCLISVFVNVFKYGV